MSLEGWQRHRFYCFSLSLFLSFASLATNADQSISSLDFDKLVVRGFQGRVKVVGATTENLSYSLRSLGDKSSDWPLEIVKEGRTLRLEVKTPDSKTDFFESVLGGKTGVPSHELSVRMPNRPIEVHWQNGDIQIQGLKSNALVNHMSGNVSIKDCDANIKVRSHSGTVDVEGLKARIDIESYKGKLNVNKVTGKVSANNFSGVSRFNEIEGGIVVSTYSGNVNAEKIMGGVEFNTHRGPITLNTIQGEVTGKTNEAAVKIGLKGKPLVRVRSESGAVTVSTGWNKGYWANLGTEKGDMRIPGGLKTEHYGSWRVAQGNVPGDERGRVFVRTSSGNIRVGR